MDQQRRDQLVTALQAKGVNRPCPRCGNSRFELVGESVIAINETPGAIVVGGPAVPVVLVACAMCGYVTQHAQGALGVMRGE